MALRVERVPPAEFETLIPVLSEADEDDERIRAQIDLPGRVAYRAVVGEEVIGAATMRWHSEESEIVHIAVLPQWRGRDYGKAIVAALLAEANERRVASVIVGTANSSLDNIAFYQRCGFRMDHVRRDYFSYLDHPILEQGIAMRDMLVLRHDLGQRGNERPDDPATRATGPPRGPARRRSWGAPVRRIDAARCPVTASLP